MPIDFDPVFHTESMVKILREQGSTQYAMELAELILQKNPEHEGVRKILAELREDARRAFDRFKSGGRLPEAPSLQVEAPAIVEASVEVEFPVPEAEVAVSQAEAVSAMEEEVPIEEFAPSSESIEPLHESVRLTLVPSPVRVSSEKKIRRLQSLLHRVQSLGKAGYASQA